jgi:hypothetical protein
MMKIIRKESELRGLGIDFTPEGWFLQSHNPLFGILNFGHCDLFGICDLLFEIY